MERFQSTAELVTWMQEEYLSALLSRALKPKPGAKLPKQVTFTWGLIVPDEDRLQMFGITAMGIKRWSLDGEWDQDHQELSFVPEPRGEAPIVLHQLVPGLLVLECDRVEVERLPAKKWKPPPAPAPDHFVVWGARELSCRQIVEWIAPPGELRLFEQLPGGRGNRALDAAELEEVVKAPRHAQYRLQRAADDESAWLFMSWGLSITVVGHYLVLRRGTLDDQAWARVRQLPAQLGDCAVHSGTLRCSGAEWIDLIKGR